MESAADTKKIASATPRLFAFRFEEAALDRWYIALALFVTTLVLPPAVRFITDGVAWIAGRNDLQQYLATQAGARLSATSSAWLGFVWAAAIFVAAGLFNRWRRALRTLVPRLVVSGRLAAHRSRDTEATYLALQARYQRALLGPRRYLFAAVGLALYMVPVIRLVLSADLLYNTRRLGIVGVLFDARFTLLGLIWAPLLLYFLGMGAWIMYATSTQLKRLLENFDVTVQPSHPDHCGGLAPLGEVFIHADSAVAYVVALFAVGVSPLNLFIGTALKLVGGVGFVLFVLPLVVAIVLLPLQVVHRKMVVAKEQYEDEVATRLATLETQVLEFLEAGEVEQAKRPQTELEIVHTLYPPERAYPTWPFTGGTSMSFVAVQTLSLFGPIAGALWQASVASR
jgi:hypothetical protein